VLLVEGFFASDLPFFLFESSSVAFPTHTFNYSRTVLLYGVCTPGPPTLCAPFKHNDFAFFSCPLRFAFCVQSPLTALTRSFLLPFHFYVIDSQAHHFSRQSWESPPSMANTIFLHPLGGQHQSGPFFSTVKSLSLTSSSFLFWSVCAVVISSYFHSLPRFFVFTFDSPQPGRSFLS